MKSNIFLFLIFYMSLLNEPASALNENYGLVSNVAAEQFSQPPGKGQQAVMVRLPDKQNRLKSRAHNSLSALGFMYDWNTGVVIYVDRNSDLYTRVFQGDIYLTEDGMPANFAYQHYLNFGNQYSPVRCRFLQHGGVYECVCMRHPTSWFGPFWHQGRNRGLP